MVSLANRQLTFVDDLSCWRPLPPTTPHGRLILSDDAAISDAQINRYRDYLGHEFFQVTIDCRQQLHLDAIAALTGTVIAGGELVLLAPATNRPMFQRLRDCASEVFPGTVSCNETTPLPTLPSEAQTKLQQRMLDTDSVHLVTADRGRGKSSCLGATIAALQKTDSQQRIVITAPRRANTANLLAQAPDAQFVAWDKLLQHKQADALLVIDEAAGVPLWALQQLCQRYRPWLLATTVEGYEGSGRGFAIHFTDWLQHNVSQLKRHSLTEPLRWPEHDPLEQWLRNVLLLEPPKAVETPITGGVYHFSELNQGHQFKVFELLLEAHYQSSPNDLALLLDNPKQYLVINVHQQQVIAVAWLAIEGPLPSSLATEVVNGRRRPQGNLLPQVLGYFLQQPSALQYRWCRVVRIAVREDWRRQQIGSQLLQQSRYWAEQQDCVALGTSFGYSSGLVSFWQRNGFQFARISTAVDKVSARHAVVMVSPLVTIEAWLEQVIAYGNAEVAWLCHSRIADNPPSPIIDVINNAFAEQVLTLASAQYALTYCPALPLATRQLLKRTPLPLQELQQQLEVTNRKQLEATLRRLITGESFDESN